MGSSQSSSKDKSYEVDVIPVEIIEDEDTDMYPDIDDGPRALYQNHRVPPHQPSAYNAKKDDYTLSLTTELQSSHNPQVNNVSANSSEYRPSPAYAQTPMHAPASPTQYAYQAQPASPASPTQYASPSSPTQYAYQAQPSSPASPVYTQPYAPARNTEVYDLNGNQYTHTPTNSEQALFTGAGMDDYDILTTTQGGACNANHSEDVMQGAGIDPIDTEIDRIEKDKLFDL